MFSFLVNKKEPTNPSPSCWYFLFLKPQGTESAVGIYKLSPVQTCKCHNDKYDRHHLPRNTRGHNELSFRLSQKWKSNSLAF